MKFSELKQSNYLTQADCGRGILVTIRGYQQENVAKEGDQPENKVILFFHECEKGLVLNSTNGTIISAIVGSDDMDAAIGKKIVLYQDPNISFGGKLVGGIRARAPRLQQPPQQQMQPAPRPAPIQPPPVQQQAPQQSLAEPPAEDEPPF